MFPRLVVERFNRVYYVLIYKTIFLLQKYVKRQKPLLSLISTSVTKGSFKLMFALIVLE